MKKLLIICAIVIFGCQSKESNFKELLEDKVWVSIYSGEPLHRYYYSNGESYLSKPLDNARETKQIGSNQFSDNPFNEIPNSQWIKSSPYHRISNDTLYFTSKYSKKQIHVITLKILRDTVIDNHSYYRLQITNRNILQNPSLEGLTHTLLSKK